MGEQPADLSKRPRQSGGAVQETCRPHRRAALNAVRNVINEYLPDGYEEGIQFGMIGWYVPLSLYPARYGENPKVPRFPDPSRRLP